ncbi:hypothetical protein CARUB_v10024369mg, partial [Capsella rubella]
KKKIQEEETMSKINILIVAALLLSFMVIDSVARPDSSLQNKPMEKEMGCEGDECMMETTHAAKVMGCEGDECMMETTSDAHLDYIYTQASPPKPHAAKMGCEGDECM